MAGMLTRETADLQELEALWELPARDVAQVAVRARPWAEWVATALAIAWPVLLVGLIAFEPEPDPQAAVPAWGVTLGLALTVAAIGGVTARIAGGPRTTALGFFAGAGALGIAAAIGCRATAHHAGSWWAVETALFSVLALASVAGLVLARRS